MVHLASAGDTGIPDGLGVTGLLNELLAAQANGAADGEGGCSTGAEDEPEPEEAEVSDLALLHGEVDACLMSLGNWEAESRQRREELKMELEAKYGFSYEEALESVSPSGEGHLHRRLDEGLASEDEGDEELSARRAVFAPRGRPMFGSAAPPVDGAADAMLSNSMQRADEGRLAMLRAEVEELRRRSAEADVSHFTDAQAGEANDEMIGTANGLAAWCAELDQVLDSPGLPTQPWDENTSELQVLEEYEQTLQSARSQADRMEGALGDAYARMEAEIGDLEKLLADCDAARAKIHQAPAGAA